MGEKVGSVLSSGGEFGLACIRWMVESGGRRTVDGGRVSGVSRVRDEDGEAEG